MASLSSLPDERLVRAFFFGTWRFVFAAVLVARFLAAGFFFGLAELFLVADRLAAGFFLVARVGFLVAPAFRRLAAPVFLVPVFFFVVFFDCGMLRIR